MEESERAALNELSGAIIGAAIEVHRTLGPGYLEQLYESALCVELRARGIPFVRQPVIEVAYKGEVIGEGRLDLLVDGRIVVELKSVELVLGLHSAQLLSYLKAMKLHLGLLINFNVARLTDGGVQRVIRD
ncbi:MAG: GxxExxY protein [Dehalococcoidia bacterium]